MKKRGNGQGSVYKRGETYRAQVTRYEGGRRLTKTKGGFLTKKDAYEWCVLNSKFDTLVCPTFEKVFEDWKATHYPTISAKKQQQYDHVYAESASLYKKKFDGIALRHFQAVVNVQKETYNVRKIFKSVYSMVSDYAIRNGYITINNAKLIELPPTTKPNKAAFTADEVQKVWEHYHSTKDMTAGACLIMLYTGMRYGEISTISPDNIHLEEGYLTGGIKTEAGKHGEIILINKIKPVVQDILLPENRVARIGKEGFRKAYDKMQSAAGIKRHTVHECRHTTATLLAEAGVQPAIIAAIMRHTNYSQTLEYTHITRTTKQENLALI